MNWLEELVAALSMYPWLWPWVYGFAVSVIVGHFAARWLIWLYWGRPTGLSWIQIFGFEHIPPPWQHGNDSISLVGALPSWVVGLIERVFFTIVVASAGGAVGAATMIGWIGIKTAIHWKRRDRIIPTELTEIIRASQVSTLASLTSMLFALIGGLIILLGMPELRGYR